MKYHDKQSNKKLIGYEEYILKWQHENYNLHFAVHTGTYWGIRLLCVATRNGQSPWQKSRILRAVMGDQWAVPIVQFIPAEKITQKFIHSFDKYWNMKLSAILWYNSKLNNHTYLKLIQLNQEKNQGSLQMKTVIQQPTWKILVISNTIISKDDKLNVP